MSDLLHRGGGDQPPLGPERRAELRQIELDGLRGWVTDICAATAQLLTRLADRVAHQEIVLMWADVLNQLATRSWSRVPVRVAIPWLAADLSAWPTTTPTERIMWSVQSVMRWIGRMASFDPAMVERLTAIATMYAHLLRDLEPLDGDEAC